MFFSFNTFTDNFSELKLVGNSGKRGGEQTTGLGVFLAVDMVQKQTGANILDLNPDNGEHRAVITARYAEILGLFSTDDEEYQVNDLGSVNIESRRKRLEKKLSSNFMTTRLKKAADIRGTANYPSRPAPLLTLGLQVAPNNEWGVMKYDGWSDNFLRFLGDRLCGEDTFPLIVFLLRTYSFTNTTNPQSCLLNALHTKYSEEVSNFLVSKATIPNNWGSASFFNDNPINITQIHQLVEEDEEEELATLDMFDEVDVDGSVPKNQILYGPPGTGKTYRTAELALKVCGYWNEELASDRRLAMNAFRHLQNNGRVEFVTFHQSISYEEFVEGISTEIEDGNVKYYVKDGIFKEVAKKALESLNGDDVKNFVLIIDEINRANISKVFGELITLIEEDKRTGEENEVKVRLPYSQEAFSVPSNLYIIGTMNTADRSIALMDIALRRRFDFEEIVPQHNLLSTFDENGQLIELPRLLEAINKRITVLLDRNHTFGQALFMSVGNFDELVTVLRNKIIPTVQEYFYGQWDKVAMVMGDTKKEIPEHRLIIEDHSYDIEALFGKNDFNEQIEAVFMVNPNFGNNRELDIKIIQGIYS
ncbi:McrB family protein [Paenibacillus glycanilyticus]|uniref:McrB family protein n=1 Tax=Paenibacillus glycanilyticus TaxID=126569 RepID=UPI003EBF0BDE